MNAKSHPGQVVIVIFVPSYIGLPFSFTNGLYYCYYDKFCVCVCVFVIHIDMIHSLILH